MIRNYFFAVVLFLSLSACAVSHKQLDSNQAYSSHQYSGPDLDISWKTEKLDNAILINGTVTNIRTSYVYDDLELDATILDAQGKVIAMYTHSFTPLKLKGSEPFKMTIPIGSGMQPESIKFNYRYGIDEDRFSVTFVSKM